jgi:hypothetical protein
MSDNEDDQQNDDGQEDGEKKGGTKSFTALDVQKYKLEKLMKNIDKPVEIPGRRTGRKGHDAPDFVRNVMGSSAGAGSGEFHVYRHLRRKEFARLRGIDEQAKREHLDEAYQEKLEANRVAAEEKTAKKRQKRLKKKQKARQSKKKGKSGVEDASDSDGSSEGGDEDVVKTIEPQTTTNEAVLE